MKDYRDRSKERFQTQTTKLLRDLMVSCLDRAEKVLGTPVDSPRWGQFRFDILNLGNDKIRLLDDVLKDYDIEFRPPIVFSVKYNSIPFEKWADFQFKFDGAVPILSIDTGYEKTIQLLIKAIGCGTSIQLDTGWRYHVEGMYDIFNKVIPFFNKSECLKGKTLEKYMAWKEQVYTVEKGNA